MKLKKHDWLMMMLVVPLALLGAIILWIGAKDIEEHQRQHQHDKETTLNIDSIRRAQKELRLKTLEDSVHFYEDGM